jgi:hypothetical protein
MRLCVCVAVVLAVSSAAHAESSTVVSFDFGYLWDRVAVTDQTAIDGQLVRFGFRVAFDIFHFGAEVDEASLAGTTTRPDGAIARTTMVVPAGSPLSGDMVAPKLVIGAHTRLRNTFSLAAELAGGVRDTQVNSDYGFDIAGRKKEPVFEARSRLDWWLSRTLSIGAIASTDMRIRQDVAFGFVVSANL